MIESALADAHPEGPSLLHVLLRRGREILQEYNVDHDDWRARALSSPLPREAAPEWHVERL